MKKLFLLSAASLAGLSSVYGENPSDPYSVFEIDNSDIGASVKYDEKGEAYQQSNSNPNLRYYPSEDGSSFVPKTYNLTPTGDMKLDKRRSLEAEVAFKETEYNSASHGAAAAKTTIAQKDEEIETELKRLGSGQDIAEVLGQDNFLTQLDADETLKYANASAAVYDSFAGKNIRNRSDSETAIDRQISNYQSQKDSLEARSQKIREAFSELSGKKLEAKIKSLTSDLEQNFGTQAIQRDGRGLQGNILEKINAKINDLDTTLEGLFKNRTLQNASLWGDIKESLKLNRFAQNYDVVNVMYRNNGEFSGVVLFDKTKNEMLFVMAGSKSKMDWLWNFAGWNQTLSAKHGLLTGLHIHAGFARHFEDMDPSFMATTYSWMKQWKQDNPGEALTIHGTGHSLGGALAEIYTASAIQMAEASGINVGKRGTITFGAPNVYNSADIPIVEKIMGGRGNSVRIQDSNDPVPKAAFWRDSPGVVIKAKISLFFDAGGVAAFPFRNPHSSSDYYHFADRVFQAWKDNVEGLERVVGEKKAKEAELRTFENEKTEALFAIHRKTTEIANHDVLSATNFVEDYKKTLEALEKEVDSRGLNLKEGREKLKNKELTAVEIKKGQADIKTLEAADTKAKSALEALRAHGKDAHWKKVLDQQRADLDDMLASTLMDPEVLFIPDAAPTETEKKLQGLEKVNVNEMLRRRNWSAPPAVIPQAETPPRVTLVAPAA